MHCATYSLHSRVCFWGKLIERSENANLVTKENTQLFRTFMSCGIRCKDASYIWAVGPRPLVRSVVEHLFS